MPLHIHAVTLLHRYTILFQATRQFNTYCLHTLFHNLAPQLARWNFRAFHACALGTRLSAEHVELTRVETLHRILFASGAPLSAIQDMNPPSLILWGAVVLLHPHA